MNIEHASRESTNEILGNSGQKHQCYPMNAPLTQGIKASIVQVRFKKYSVSIQASYGHKFPLYRAGGCNEGRPHPLKLESASRSTRHCCRTPMPKSLDVPVLALEFKRTEVG